MSRCKEFYDKWEKDPNWCEKCPSAVSQINSYIDLLKELDIESTVIDNELSEKPVSKDIDKDFAFVKLSEGAARPLITEKDPIIKEKAIETIKKCLESGKNLSGEFFKKINTKDVEDIIKKVRRDEANKIPIELPAMSERYQIIHDDFQNVKIEPNSIDLILTDPPYPEEFLPSWEDLGEFAKTVLKPSGFLVTYSGELHLPEALNSLSEKLKYYWTMCLIHQGKTQNVFARNMICGWKPILIFQKTPFKKLEMPVFDVITTYFREKESHDWQQGIDGVSKLVNLFSKEGDTILDPFAGSGTTLIASLKTNRKGIAIEKEKEYIETIKRRVYELQT